MSGSTVTTTLEMDVTSGSARAAAPTFTDISTFMLDPLTIKRGRSYELAEMDNGESSLPLDNSGRDWDPTHATGPYYPNLKPMRPFRFSALLSAVTYRVFTGYVLEFPPVWEGPSWSYVNLRCVDGMGPLALSDLIGVFAQEATGTRVGHVLDAIGFPAANRVIDTGASNMASVTYAAADGKNALEHIRECERTENGLFFFDGQGRAVFKSRRSQLTAQATSKATFGDSGTDMDYETAPGDYSERLIYNSVTVTDSAGNATTATDTSSQDSYWPRSLAWATQLPAASTEAANAAAYLLSLYKQPGFRFKSIAFIASLNDTAMLEALTREIGDRITVRKTPPGGGVQISQDCIVQSIEHEIHAGTDWRTTYELAPADAASYWILDTSTLDLDTRLAY